MTRFTPTLLATIGGALATLAFSTMPAHALGTPVITSPTGNLSDGGTVSVQLSDLTPGASYNLGICDGNGSGGIAPACDLTETHYVSFTATGTTATQALTAAKEFVTVDHGGTTKAVSCLGSTGVQCYLVISQHTAPYPSSATAVTFN